MEPDELIEDLQENFKVEELKINPRKEADKAAELLMKKVEEAGKKATSMAMALRGGRAFILSLKKNRKPESLAEDHDIPPEVARLDVSLLHHYIIPHIWIGNPEVELDEDDVSYMRNPADALKMLATRRACAVFLMNPPKMEQVIEVSRKGIRLPHKTTYFYPKIISGLVMRDMKTFGV